MKIILSLLRFWYGRSVKMKEIIISKKPLSFFFHESISTILSLQFTFIFSLLIEGLLYVFGFYNIHVANILVQFLLLYVINTITERKLGRRWLIINVTESKLGIQGRSLKQRPWESIAYWLSLWHKTICQWVALPTVS